jgi:FkbM family methyltransferase
MLAWAIADPDGYGMLNLMMHAAGIKEKYREVFFRIKPGDLCIDCGANIGAISDIIVKCGGVSYAFEPSKDAFELLSRKYKNNTAVHLINSAVSNKNGEAVFNTSNAFDIGANISNPEVKLSYEHSRKYNVKVTRLTDFISGILSSSAKRIYLLKIDVEGEEFNILEDLIQTGIYKDIGYIFCETHERFGKTLREKLEALKNTIKEKKIENIYLDWI